MVDIPHTPTTGSVIVASELEDNFDVLADATEALRSSNFAEDAGILSTQIADRYHLDEQLIPLFPITSTDTIAAPGAAVAADMFEIAAASYQIYRQRITLQPGQEAYLCEAEFYVRDIEPSGDPFYPTLELQIEGAIIGDSAVTIDEDDDFWRVRLGDEPINTPLRSVNDGDELVVLVGRTGAAACHIAGVTLRLLFKKRMTN